jgi:phenylalanyl-tRNA synthetase beta chain
LPISVKIDNEEACKRYSGISIANLTIKESPTWLQQRLKSIGLRPLNNIVDITNYIQHETGQPLHAFDYDEIKGKRIIVKNANEGSIFKTLDEKERKLSIEDLMICNAEEGMCIAGVFGGVESGVSNTTKNIFLESAYFDPATIRKTSFRHGLRTDAATRFEKGIDISATVRVLEHAALLIKEIAGGEIASNIIDEYPNPQPKKEVLLKYQYLRKLSGTDYKPDAIKNILKQLGFEIIKESADVLLLKVPYHKPDISLPADVVEEILRIDGLDNIEIPTAITITPLIEENYKIEALKEKIANLLTGFGFTEILTNSITNSKYFKPDQLENAVKLLNNLSSELDVMRPIMLPTALEAIAYNVNRKNNDLQLFEFGKTYKKEGTENYIETNHLCLYLTGNISAQHWKIKDEPADIYFLKGIAEAVSKTLGILVSFDTATTNNYFERMLKGSAVNDSIVKLGKLTANMTSQFDIKQPVFFADFNWDIVLKHALSKKIKFSEIPKFHPVERDISMLVNKSMSYEEIKNAIDKQRLTTLQNIKLFDVFESEKLGRDKKSIAVNFTFLDKEKTLTDKEIENWMNKIMTILEKEVGAEIRK